jgi:hypothetical protein
MKLLGNICFYSGSFLLISSMLLGSNPLNTLESVVLFTAISFIGLVAIIAALVCWSYDLG